MKSNINSRIKVVTYAQNHKKTFLKLSKNLIIAAFVLLSTAGFSQENPTESKPKRDKKEKMSPEQRNQTMLNKMTKELNLDAKQQEQIKPLLAEQADKMKIWKEEQNGKDLKDLSPEERKALMRKRKEERNAFDAKLQAILTPDQFKKMKENQEANKEKMKEMRAQRQP